MSGVLQRRPDPMVAGAALATLGLAFIFGVTAGFDAKLGVIAALGFAFVLVAFADLTAGLVLFMIGIFLESVVASGAVLSFPKLGGLLLAAAWLVRLATEQDGRTRTFLSRHAGATYILAAFLAWAALSLLWSVDAGEGLTDVYRYALNVVLLLLVFSAVQTRHQATLVLGGIIVCSTIAALYGLVLHPPTEQSAFRETGASGNPNEFAEVALTGISFALASAVAVRRTPLLRFALISVAAICMIALFLTASRSGVIALAVALIAAIAFGGRARIGLALMAVLIVIGGVTFYATFAPPEARARIEQSTPGQVPAEEGRYTIWDVAFRAFEDKPFHGVGAGNFETVAVDYVLQPGLLTRTDEVIDQPKVAHSIYLQFAAELGLVGLVLFLSFAIFSIWTSLRAGQLFAELDDRLMEGMARATTISLIALLALFAFHSSQFSKLFWLLLALGPALLLVAERARAEIQRSAA